MGIRLKMMGIHYGVHLPQYSPTSRSPIELAPLPERVIIPLYQNNGVPCNALVKRGDRVLTGQRIGDSEDFAATPIHATVSGEVSNNIKLIDPLSGCPGDALIITSDGKDEWVEIKALENPWSLSAKDIVDKIREAGIVGGREDDLPAHVKLSPPEGKRIDTVILNGCQGEPFLTSNQRLMLENGEKVLSGLSIIKQVLSPSNIYIAIEDNNNDVIAHIEKLITTSGLRDFRIVPVKSKYPSGTEKVLIDALLGRDVPINGTPLDIGVVVADVSMAKAIHDAIIFGKPFIEQVITVTRRVKKPKNLLVRFGTPIRHLIDYCGGIKGEANEVIIGGLMMGVSQYNLDSPVTKGANGIFVEKYASAREYECIRCGWCLEVCPVRLVPSLLATYAKAGRYNECKEAYIDNCFECGACAYICPSNIPLVQYIKLAKAELVKRSDKI